jgi:hypothetical protein
MLKKQKFLAEPKPPQGIKFGEDHPFYSLDASRFAKEKENRLAMTRDFSVEE